MKYVNETTIVYIYAAVVFTLVFSAGWFSGLGGSLVANLVFAAIMGSLAALAIKLITRSGKPKK